MAGAEAPGPTDTSADEMTSESGPRPMSECMKDSSLDPGATEAGARRPRPIGPSPQQHGAMSGETLQRRVTIVNPQGFHMRPQSLFVQLANRFASTVTVSRGDQRVNGKSQWELMLL